MNFKILAIGGVLQEIIYNTDGANVIQSGSRRRAEKMIAVSYGSKISSNQVWRSFGGGALNSLATFRSLGLAAAPVSVVGDDLAGYEIRHYLARQKVYTKLVAIDKNRETAVSFVLNLPKDKEHVVVVSQGA
jgi:sugar/nucleoside kinase (ribokinase family)